MDRTDWIFCTIIGVMGLAAVAGVVVTLMQPDGPTLELRKADFTCTRSHSQLTGLISVGKVMVPMFETVCDEYQRKE